MTKAYQIASKADSGKLREFLAEYGETLRPMVELHEVPLPAYGAMQSDVQ